MRYIVAVVVLLLVASVSARPKWHQLRGYTFDQYIQDFGRAYKRGEPEYALRKSIFDRKVAEMIKHNEDPSFSWKRGVNMFTDMTSQEWKNYNRAYKSPLRSKPLRVHTARDRDEAPLPKEVDYRTWTSPRVLTAVKHQGSCGNCWSISATETLESYYALLTNMLSVFSMQQITSCTTMCNGCNGGDAILGWDYVKNDARGLTEEWCYPFTNFFYNYTNPNAQTAPCKNISTEYPKKPYTWFAELNRVGVQGYISVTPNNASATMDALATRGPLSISVAAGNWQDYETGIMSNTGASGNNSEWSIDHSVQMVGYGHDKELGKDYWIVRNSWSTLWGEDGFVRLDRPAVEPCSPSEFGPVCGTSGCLNDPHYPKVIKSPPTKF